MLIDWLEFLILSFASYRLARAITWDSLLESTQDRIAAEFDSEGNVAPVTDDSFMVRPWATFWKSKSLTLASCPLCLNYWIGLGMLCVWVGGWPWDLGWEGWITSLAVAALPTAVLVRETH